MSGSEPAEGLLMTANASTTGAKTFEWWMLAMFAVGLS